MLQCGWTTRKEMILTSKLQLKNLQKGIIIADCLWGWFLYFCFIWRSTSDFSLLFVIRFMLKIYQMTLSQCSFQWKQLVCVQRTCHPKDLWPNNALEVYQTTVRTGQEWVWADWSAGRNRLFEPALTYSTKELLWENMITLSVE